MNWNQIVKSLRRLGKQPRHKLPKGLATKTMRAVRNEEGSSALPGARGESTGAEASLASSEDSAPGGPPARAAS